MNRNNTRPTLDIGKNLTPITLFSILISIYFACVLAVFSYWSSVPNLGIVWSSNTNNIGLHVEQVHSASPAFNLLHPGDTVLSLSYMGKQHKLNAMFIKDINHALQSKENYLQRRHTIADIESLFQSNTVDLHLSNLQTVSINTSGHNYLASLNFDSWFLLFSSTCIFMIISYVISFSPPSLLATVILIAGISFCVYNITEAPFYRGGIHFFSIELLRFVILFRFFALFFIFNFLLLFPTQLIKNRFVYLYFIVIFLGASLAVLDSDLMFNFNELMITLLFPMLLTLYYQWQASKSVPKTNRQFWYLAIIVGLPTVLFNISRNLGFIIFDADAYSPLTVSFLALGSWTLISLIILRSHLKFFDHGFFAIWSWIFGAALALTLSGLVFISLSLAPTISVIIGFIASLWICLPLRATIIKQLRKKQAFHEKHLHSDLLKILESNQVAEAIWNKLLIRAYSLDAIDENSESIEKPFIAERGSILHVKHFNQPGSLKLIGKNGAKQFFTTDDLLLAQDLRDMLNSTETQRFAKMEGRKIERVQNMQEFSAISHELRTPLALILGNLEHAKDQLNDLLFKKDTQSNAIKTIDNAIDVAQKSGGRLLHIVNQLLELGRISVINQKQDDIFCVNDEVERIFHDFIIIANNKNIELIADKTASIWIKSSLEYFEKILVNIIANAIKYTPRDGKVVLRYQQENNHLELCCQDTGIGITDTEINHIFDRFYRVNDVSVQGEQGSGLGLAVVKELLHALGGRISVTSEHGKGTQFDLQIPVEVAEKGLAKVNNPDAPTPTPNQIDDLNRKTIHNSDTNNPKTDISITNTREKPSILLVEDNADMQQYVSQLLSPTYAIDVFNSGELAIQHLDKKTPDLILSDVMMGGMSGFDFCQIIKTSNDTNHIPLILLTAKTEIESRLEGYESGADDYISKPFNRTELPLRIAALLTQRERLRARFDTQTVCSIPLTSESQHDVFIDKLSAKVMDNLDSIEFGASQLASDLAMSLRTLQLKTKSLTGKTPSQLLSQIRIEAAANIILKEDISITALFGKVGFDNPSYFSKLFKKRFGVTPKSYKEDPSAIVLNAI